MALRDVVIETSEVVYGGGNFSVHGITLDMIVKLMTLGHRAEMEAAVETIRKAVGEDLENAGKSEAIIGALATTMAEVPVLVSKVIAGAADDLDQWEKVQHMPMSVQLDALMKIGKLTFDGEDSVKKFVTDLIQLMMAMRKSATPAVQAAKEQLAGMKA